MINRSIEAEVRDILAVSRAAAILGPRQAGKSTLALELARTGLVPNVYSLDQDQLLRAALDDPDGFVAGLKLPAVLDEVQRAPRLMLSIKQVIDSSDKPGQFLLTGSANLTTMAEVADALPGRIEYVNLWPFSQGELIGKKETFLDRVLAGDVPRLASQPVGRVAYAERVVVGGFPGSRGLSSRRRAGFFDSYLRTVTARDVAQLSPDSTAPAHLEDLIQLLATRSAGLLNLSGLARDLGVSDKTVLRHFELLEQMFLVFRLRPWSGNLGQRRIKTPKVFLTDTGMMAAMVNLDAESFGEPLRAEFAGALLESFVLMELVKQSGWSGQRVQFSFYRDAEGREVDLVIESAAGAIVGIETKAAATVHKQDARGLRYLAGRLRGTFRLGLVLYTGASTVQLEDGIWAVPVSALWE